MVSVKETARLAKNASYQFAPLSTMQKNKVLEDIRLKLLANEKALLAINAMDLEQAKTSGMHSAFFDRLMLNERRIALMCEGLSDIIALPDYVGRVAESYPLKNGLLLKKVHAPLGVIGIIYEARPNVTVDAAALCIKSGNGVVLKGGKESLLSNRFLVGLMKEALKENGIDENLIGFVDGTDRALTVELLKCAQSVDVVIPRGGESLKKFVLSEAAMPVIASSGGNCHVYVEKTADFAMAQRILENAKLQRPSVCNAAETLLVDRAIAKAFLPAALSALRDKGVEIRGTTEVKDIYSDTVAINDEEFYREYEDLIIKVKVVENSEEAIAHINAYSTGHSDAVVTANSVVMERFGTEVDSAAVYINASTRFTDGFVFGLGAEMGISTQKLHVRGPIGLKELTSVKYIIVGEGQIRE